jgi:hypothetical protein
VSSDTEDVRGAATGAADAAIANLKVVKESIESLVGSWGGKWMLSGTMEARRGRRQGMSLLEKRQLAFWRHIYTFSIHG